MAADGIPKEGIMAGCDSGIPGTSVSVNPTCDADELTPEQFVNCVLNFQQESGVKWANDAQDMAGAAICSAKGLDLSIARDESPYEVTAEEPPVPDDIDNTIAKYDALSNTMLPLFDDTFDDYFTRNHVVLYNPAYQAAASWLTNVISNGVSGIPVSLENQIYDRATSRIRAEAALARQRGINRSASLGWKLPNPAVVALAESEALAGYQGMADASVRLAEKQIDIQIDSVKFAVEEANKVYLGMERNAIDYLTAWTRMLDHIKDLVQIDPNVRANYINAVSNLFGQRIKKDQVQWMSLNDFYQRLMQDNQLKSSNALGQTDLVVKANTAASEVMKMLAAAVLSQLSTMVTKVATG
jgi:hypothetical protein